MRPRPLGPALALAAALLAPAPRADAAPPTPPADPPSTDPATPTTTADPAAPVTAADPSQPSLSQPSPPQPSPPPPSPPHPSQLSGPRRALAVGAAVVPGLLVHGSGHFVAGHHSTAYRLVALEGAGLGGVIGGLAALAATGASRRFVGPLAAVTVTGAGLFVISAAADLYGVLAPEGGTGSPPLYLPWVETQLGMRYVYDPVFDYRLFAAQGVDLRWGSLRLYPSGWFALDDANARVRALAGYRLLGPRTPGSPAASDGSFLEAEAALTHHRYASDQFAITTAEIALQGRLDLHHIGPTLRGSFAELGGGLALESHRYDELATETTALLLMRFAFGMYLGHSGYPRGEAQIYYDHRHDGFAGGMKMPGLGSGVPGHFGVEGRMYLDRQWGLLLDAQVGSAWLGGLSLLFRHGGNP